MSGAIGTFAIGTSAIGGGSSVSTPSGVTAPVVSKPTAVLAPGTTFYLEWNGDLVLTPSGSVTMASGWDSVRERILRRFLTNSAVPLPDGTTTPPDYVFSPLYGLGAGALIDQNPNEQFISTFTSRMRQAVAADSATDPGSLPSILVTTPQIGTIQVYVGIQLISGQQGNLTLTF